MIHRRVKLLALLCGLTALAVAPSADAQIKIIRAGIKIRQVIEAAPAQPGQPGVAGLPGQPAPASPRLLQRLGTTQYRHGSRVLCLAYAPSGKFLAAGGGSDPVRLWDTETGKTKFLLSEPWANAVVFTPRGSVLITGGASRSIRLWEVSNGKDFGKMDGHEAPVKALAISPDGTLLASADQRGNIILWEWGTKKEVARLKGHSDEVTSLSFNFDGSLLASASADRSVVVWDTDTNKKKHTFDAGCSPLAVAMAPSDKTDKATYVYAGGDDNVIRVWDAETGKAVGTLKGHENFVTSLVIPRENKIIGGKTLSPNTLVSGGLDGTMRIWDLTAMDKAPRIIRRHTGDSDALSLSKDGTRIATAGLNNTIRIFESVSGKEILPAPGPTAPLGQLALSKDGKLLASISGTGSLYVWDAKAGKPLRDWPAAPNGETQVAFAPDGNSLVTAHDSVRFWNPHTGQELFQLTKTGSPVVGLAFSPDGKTLAVGLHGNTVQLWDVPAKQMTGQIKYAAGRPYALGFSTNGKLLGISGGSEIVICDAAGKELRKFNSKEAPPKSVLPEVAALAFSPDGKTLAAACYDGAIRMIDHTRGKEVAICEGHLSVPYGIAFSADGRTLVSGSFDGTARLWEPFAGQTIAILTGHVGPVQGVALSPDGRRVYSSSSDTTLIVWDATGHGKDGPPTVAMSKEDLDAAWKDLASEDSGKANILVWRMIGAGKGVPTFLDGKIYVTDVERREKLLKDLDSDDFNERKDAFEELAQQGIWLQPRLEQALNDKNSLEYRRRIEQLLEKLKVPGALSMRQELLRYHRAMVVLEQVNDDVSRKAFARISRGGPLDIFQESAKASIERLKNGKGS